MDLETFRALLSSRGQQLLTEIENSDEVALPLGTRLRRVHPADLVAAAIQQQELRRRARTKFGSDADVMYFTRDGLEQATVPAVARYRFGRLSGAGGRSFADLCCGIGADLVVAAGHYPSAVGIDVDPLTCAVARANVDALGVAATVVEDDVEAIALDGYDSVFADPARRGSRGRAWNRADYRPGWDFVEKLLERTGCVKTSPALPHHAIPPATEAEWISLDGQTREVCLWSPDLRSTDRRATVLTSAAGNDTIVSADSPSGVEVRPMGRYVHDVDPAVAAAHLVEILAAQLGGWLIDQHIGYVSTDRGVSSPFARTYEVLEELPYPLRKLRQALRARDIGRLTIKKRGLDVEPSLLRGQLGLRGSTEATLLLTRAPGGARAYLVDPLPREI